MPYLKRTKRSASIRLTPAGAPSSVVEGQIYFAQEKLDKYKLKLNDKKSLLEFLD